MNATLHIARDGKSLGSFSEEEVLEGLREGESLAESEGFLFYPHDLVWRDGMKEWQPLGEMVELWGLSLAALEVEEKEEPPLLTVEPAWERREEIGGIPAFFGTIGDILLQPKKVFAQLPLEGGIGSPLFFFLIWSTLMGWISMFYRLPFWLSHPDKVFPQLGLEALSHHQLLLFFWATIVFLPILNLFSLWLSSWSLHLALRFLRLSQEPFQVSLRMFCYLKGAFATFALLPILPIENPFYNFFAFCWTFFSIIYFLYILFIMVHRVHSTSTRETVSVLIVAVLIGLLVMVGVLFLLSFLISMVGGLLYHTYPNNPILQKFFS